LVAILLALLTAWGLWNYTQISRREDPEIKISVALVVTIWPGASAEKVERLVTRKLEDKIEEIGEVEKIQSTSRENLSVIVVEVAFASDVAMAWQKLRNKLAEAKGDLPESVMGPDVMDDFGDVTSMIWTLSSETASYAELKELAEDFKSELRKVESVGKIEVFGTQPEVVYVEGTLETFSLYGFSPLVIAQFLDYQNIKVPAGNVRTPVRNFRLEPTGAFERVEQIEDAVIDVSRSSGSPLKVRDVFAVRRSYREPPLDLMFTNGVPCVGVDVRMKDGHNIVRLGEEVKAAAAGFRGRLPEHVQLDLVHDQPRHVDAFINEFMVNLVEGLAIVIVVLMLFMGFRTATVVAVSLPLSVILTFALMPSFAVDLETVSIASFIISLGMLVDNAIIVADNIYAHIERGTERYEACWRGVQEIAAPLITGTLGTVFAFMPLLLMKEEIGAYIRSLPIVVSLSLGASLLLAVTVTPILAAWLLPRTMASKKKVRKTAQQSWYGKVMRVGFKLRYLVILAALAGMGGSLLLLKEVGMSFFPVAHRDQFNVDIWLPEGVALDETLRVAQTVDAALREDPEVLSTVTYVGKGGPRYFITVMPEFNTNNYAQIMVNTASPEATDRLVRHFNAAIGPKMAGARVSAAKLLMGIPVDAPIAFRITGPDYRVAREISQQIQTILGEVEGTAFVRDNLGNDVPSFRIDIDAEALSMFGITGTEVALTLLTAFDGLPMTKMQAGDRELPVQLRMRHGDHNLSDVLRSLRVASQATGGKVPLAAFASVHPEWGPGIIKRYNNRRAVTAMSDVHGRLADEVVREVKPRVESLVLPPGYNIESSGEEAERDKAFGQLIIIFVLIVVAILLLLVVQFGSLKEAVVILMSVPLAIIGAILGLFFSGNSFSFMAFLGVVSLAGMVIKNAVVWGEFVQKELREGKVFEDAIIEAGRQRLRPIILTAATTIGGLLPLALFGGALWEGMAWAMVAGLAFATVLTLVAIPIIYYAFFQRGYRKARKRAAAKEAATVVASGAAALLGLSLLVGAPGTAAAEHPILGYIAQAEEASLMVEEARLELRAAALQTDAVAASFYPSVLGEISATRLDKAQTLQMDVAELGLPISLPDFVLADQNVYQARLKVTWPIYAGGKRMAGLQAARHGEAARRHAMAAVQEGVAFGTVALYVQILEAEARLVLLQERLEAERALVDIARAKVAADMGTDFDVLYAETLAADTQRLIAETRSEVRERVFVFNDLIGAPLSAEVELEPLSVDTTFSPDVEGDFSSLYHRSELSAIAEGGAAQEALRQVAFGDLLPTLALLGEGGFKDGDLGYVDGGFYWMVTLALQWNLMSDPAAWKRVEAAELEQERSARAWARRLRAMEVEYAQALRQWGDMEEIMRVARAGVRTAQAANHNARRAHAAELLGQDKVIETSREMNKLKEAYLQAYYGRILTEVQLRYRAGLPLLTAQNLAGPGALEALQIWLEEDAP